MTRSPFQRLVDSVANLPAWVRPPICGVAIIWLWIPWRMFIVLPLAVLGIALTSDTPLTDIGTLALAVLLATCGGALAGFAFSLVGRPLAAIPVVGAFVAGPIVVAPYFASVMLIVRIVHKVPLVAQVTSEEAVIAGTLSLLVGAFAGPYVFRDG